MASSAHISRTLGGKGLQPARSGFTQEPESNRSPLAGYELQLEILQRVSDIFELIRHLQSSKSPEFRPELLTTRTAARLVDVNQKTIERRIRSGQLKGLRLKGDGPRRRLYVRPEDLFNQFEPAADA